MLLSLLQSNDPREIVITLLLFVPILMMALSIHEAAHGYVAYKCGDPTAYNLGRLTLSPFAHLDPLGMLAMLIFGFGWAKPVPINTRNFRNPKRGMVLSALAGPASNLILGLLCAFLTGISSAFYLFALYHSETGLLITFLLYLSQALYYGAFVNVLFAIFNMIPVPPFDGSRLALAFLPTHIYFKLMRYERQILIVTLIAILMLDRFHLSPFSFVADWLVNLVYAPTADLFFKILSPLF